MACLLLPFAVYAQDVTLKNKNDAKVAYNKGIESINEKNYWVALEYLTAALDFNPEFAPAYLMRGKVNLELNKVRESIQDFSYKMYLLNLWRDDLGVDIKHQSSKMMYL